MMWPNKSIAHERDETKDNVNTGLALHFILTPLHSKLKLLEDQNGRRPQHSAMRLPDSYPSSLVADPILITRHPPRLWHPF